MMRRDGKDCGRVCADGCASRVGRSPVYVATYEGHVSCVEALIRMNADVLQCDK
jgi:hypothetical protein